MADISPETAPVTRASWLVVFTDLVALMLTFFVMLFSMTNVSVGQWTHLIDTLSRTFNPAKTVKSKIPTAQFNISSEFRRQAKNLDYLNAVLGEKIKDDPLLSQSIMAGLEDRLVIALPGVLLFNERRAAVLSAEGRDLLFKLSGILRLLDNQVGINSYVAAGSHRDGTYKSEWELSLGRSVAVNNEFQRAGYPESMLSFGYGTAHTSYLKAVPEAWQAAFADRVDIVVMSSSNLQ